MNPEIVAINARQVQVEQGLQVAASAIKEADERVLDALKALNRAKATKSLEVPYSKDGVKLLAAERELMLWELTEEEWTEHRVAEIAAEYARNNAKAYKDELMGLCSRANRYLEADKAHVRFGA